MTNTQSNETGVRKVKKLVSGYPATDGAGVKLVRVLGRHTISDFDPFLLLDAFDSTNPDDYIKGFPMHPHRGIETVTYLVEGRIEHQDSLGNHGVILGGGCQWMTAGRSILHQEMPKASPRMLGLQLWVNLPRAQKMVPPKYRDITSEMLPKIHEKGASVSVLSGVYKGQASAMEADYVPVTFLDVRLEPGATWNAPVNPTDTVFAYLFQGNCRFGGKEADIIEAKQAVLLSLGASVNVVGGDAGAHFVLIAGAPLHEPVAWGGPIVMNADDEIKQAFLELERGDFIKK